MAVTINMILSSSWWLKIIIIFYFEQNVDTDSYVSILGDSGEKTSLSFVVNYQ